MIEDLILELTDEDDLVMEVDHPFDMMDDTVTENDVLQGVRFHLPSGRVAYGACTYDSNTYDATAGTGDILQGKTAYVNGHKLTGTYTLSGATQATAVAGDIRKNKTAWVNGSRVTGSWTPKATFTNMTSLSSGSLWLPAGTYYQNQTFSVPFEPDNVYVNQLSSVQSVSFKQSGTTISNFVYIGVATQSGKYYLSCRYTGSTRPVGANSISVNFTGASGVFIQATIT